jgi:hypothetical protein
MKEKKITKRDVINAMLTEEVVLANADYVNYLKHELELLDKKSAKGGVTKTQIENQKICEVLLGELAKCKEPTTITDLLNNSEVLSNYVLDNGNKLTNQKLSALLRQLTEVNKVIRTTNKKKTYFSIAQ